MAEKTERAIPAGANTFLPPDGRGEVGAIELMRSSGGEKNQQVANAEALWDLHSEEGSRG